MMKKAKYFLGAFVAVVVAVAMMMFPNIFYGFYDNNVVNAVEVTEEFKVDDVEINLAPQDYLRFMNEGNATVMRTEVSLTQQELDEMVLKAVSNLSAYLKTDETETKAMNTFLSPDLEMYTRTYETMTYSGTLDGKPVTLSILEARVDFANGSIGYCMEIDMVSNTVYYFSGSGVPDTAGFPIKEKYSHKAEEALRADLREYWGITDEKIMADIECHVAPNDCFAFSLIQYPDKEGMNNEKVYSD